MQAYDSRRRNLKNFFDFSGMNAVIANVDKTRHRLSSILSRSFNNGITASLDAGDSDLIKGAIENGTLINF